MPSDTLDSDGTTLGFVSQKIASCLPHSLVNKHANNTTSAVFINLNHFCPVSSSLHRYQTDNDNWPLIPYHRQTDATNYAADIIKRIHRLFGSGQLESHLSYLSVRRLCVPYNSRVYVIVLSTQQLVYSEDGTYPE